MSTEKPAPRRKRATTQPMWQVTPERTVSKELASVTDESWGDVDALPATLRPAAPPIAKPAVSVARKATASAAASPVATAPAMKAAALGTPAPAPAPAPVPEAERPRLKSVTTIAANLSGRVTKPIEAAKPAPAKIEAKPIAKIEAKPVAAIEAKPAPAKVELKPLRPLAPLKPVESKPLPALRVTRPIEAQKPAEAKPIEAPRVAAILTRPIEAARPAALAKPSEPSKPAPRPELVKPVVPLKPVLAAELPALPAVKLPGMPPAKRLAEGSIAPPTARPSPSKPLPSLFSVIDRKRPAASTAASRPGVAVKVVAGALTAVAPLAASAAPAPRAPAPTAVVARQAEEEVDEPDYIPLSMDDLIEDAVPELLPAEDFVPMAVAATAAPLPPPPRVGQGSAATFSALEESFFAAGEELDTGEHEALEAETFDDLPPVERAGFWSRLRSSSARA